MVLVSVVAGDWRREKAMMQLCPMRHRCPPGLSALPGSLAAVGGERPAKTGPSSPGTHTSSASAAIALERRARSHREASMASG